MYTSKKWGRWFSCCTAALLFLALLSACGGKDSSAGGTNASTIGNKNGATKQEDDTPKGSKNEDYRGEFTIWTWDINHPKLLEAFKNKYPNIKMNIVNVPNGDMLKKVQTTIASGGQLPELIRIDNTFLSKYIDMDVLENLEQQPYNADRKLFFDYDIESHLNTKGKLIAIPEDMSLAGLAYKKNLTKQYLSTDDPKELEAMFPNWDAFLDKGKEVLAKSDGKVKMFASLDDAYELLRGQRPKPFFEGNKLNTGVLKDVFTKLIKFRDAGIVDKMDAWTPAWNASYAQNNHIFYPSAIWSPQYVIGPNDKSGGPRWGLITPPEGGTIWGGSSHGILKNSKTKELAYKFIEFSSMTQEGAEVFKSDGMFTHYKKAYEDKKFANWTWPNFGDQNIGEKYFVDISAKTKDVARNNNDIILSDATKIIIQALSRDKALTIDDVVNKIKGELKAKAPEITFE